ncbi:MAG: NnrS family protein [Proteobacteria bacterium]|nr:NnrS family protein [Pseudomonadota bacterium]
MNAIARPKPYEGPVLLSYGFRPFFLLGSIWAALEVLAWLPIFYGELSTGSAFAPRDWHVHELLFGYVPAVVAGFLLTAIPNWTGRAPLKGPLLAVLVGAWLAGRIAVTLSAWIGWIAGATVDAAFLVLMVAVVTREIVAGKNWRNLKIAAMLSVLAAANVGFHLEAHFAGVALYTTRLGIAVTLMLIMVVGGRIIPSFTRNWLSGRGPGRLPSPFDRYDRTCLIVSVCSLALWVAVPGKPATGVLLIVAAFLNAARLYRWAGDRTIADRLVLVLHIGYLFVPIGFLLGGLAAFDVVVPSAGIHAWTVGTIGIMTLAVMSRATLGHTGHKLAASSGTQAVYALAAMAAVARVFAALYPPWDEVFLPLSGFGWIGAFAGFAASYGPVLCRPKRTSVGTM